MTQGTISILVGCHSVIHSFLVVLSWKKLYNKFPSFWEFLCIFFHDIGHWGLNYLDDFEQKKKHWKLGADIAYRLFGSKGFLLVAGHCNYSGYPPSKLYKADKYSWYIAPKWLLFLNTIFEPKLRAGYSRMESVRRFSAQVKESIEGNYYKSTHSFFLDRYKNK